MAYSTEKDVIRVLIGRRGEDRNETPAELNVDQIRAAIADADAQINTSLKRRYAVPFSDGSVPPLVKMMSTNIASYLSLLYFRGAQPVGSEDPIALLYDRARRILADIQNDKTDIEGATKIIAAVDAIPAVY